MNNNQLSLQIQCSDKIFNFKFNWVMFLNPEPNSLHGARQTLDTSKFLLCCGMLHIYMYTVCAANKYSNVYVHSWFAYYFIIEN